MKKIILLYLIAALLISAVQAQKPPAYFYTAISEKYFTDPETDSLIHEYSAAVFRDALIPEILFEKKYPGIKQLVTAVIKKDVTFSFNEIEKKQKATIKGLPGTPAYDTNKQLYRDALKAQVQKAFAKTYGLKEYLQFNGSDRITWFSSLVQVLPDGKLRVKETIRVFNGNGSINPLYRNEKDLLPAGSDNNEIKRGIIRAFPLYYINRFKLFENTTFTIKEVLRDGTKEDYHTKKQENGILLYIGNSNQYIKDGVYTYTIVYETNHQLKLLKNFDELYWNATGNGWSFRIDSAQCTIILPKGAALLSGKCYTGVQGAANEDCSFKSSNYGDSTVIVFKTTKALPPKQGITIAASWPKGFVSGQSTWQYVKNLIWNNRAVFLLPLAALFSAIFCFIFWWKYGRDPENGTVYPLFEPPAGYSPAAMGYIYYQKHTRQLTAATIVDAAVRNKIKIEVEREGKIFKHNEYHIKPADKAAKKSGSNYEDFECDIEDLVNTTIRKGKYNSDLGDLNTAVAAYCKENYKNKDGGFKKGYRGFFATNGSYTAIPILLCVVAGGWAFVELMKALMLRNFWQIAYYIGGIILCTRVLNIFSRLLAAYSPDGRKLMDKIEGFRMFLSTADEKRLDMLNPPEKTLELYEKYLPFAIALGCEIEWGQKFESIIETAYLDGKATSSFSQSFTRDNDSFSSSFASSFSGAISSASSPPSSSSGGGSSFGGGSSGGGGGGGGGGGW